MWAARAEIEYMTDERRLSSDNDSSQKIHNTQMIQYSRTNPETGVTEKYIGWQRSVCPWKEGLELHWNRLERKRFTNEELLEQVERIAPVVAKHDFRNET